MAVKWLCLGCGGKTNSPVILRGWLVQTRCVACGRVNYHNKRGNWLRREGLKNGAEQTAIHGGNRHEPLRARAAVNHRRRQRLR